MQLNIYTFSHPIIKLLTNSIINRIPEKTLYQVNYQYIGLLLIYETLRNHIKTQKLYIKYMNCIQDHYLIDPQKTIYILTDLSNTYQMVTNINTLFPQIEVKNIDYENINILNKQIKNIHLKNANTMFFILEKTIKNEKIITVINHLINYTPITLQNISLCCIMCSDEILSKLGKIYPSLKIYTTKIIYNISK